MSNMKAEERKQVNVGDWVKLQSNKGERIHGFVEKQLEEENRVQIRVIASDNHLLTNHSIQVHVVKLQVEPDSKYYTLGELEQLIDLALQTNDKAWFDALSDQYNYLKKETEAKRHIDYTQVN